MTTNFPTSLDSLSNPASGDKLSTGHASQHANLNDAVEALQAKVGVDNSAVATSLDYRVGVLETTPPGSAAWGSIGGTLSSQTDLVNALAGKSDTSHTHTGVYEPADATILKSAAIGTTVQAYDADLGAIAGLAGTSGFLIKTGANAWSLDTSTYAPSSHNHSGVYEPVDATILRSSAIGVSVQAYNANTVVDASYVHTDNNFTTAEKNSILGKTPMSGFPVDSSGAYLVSLTYNETTRTVTITPTGATFDVYVAGTKYTKTGAQSLAHGAGQGGHFVYYDNTGTLVTGTSAWNLDQTAPVAYIFWDATNSRAVPFFELHKAGRDVFLHKRLHDVDGTQIVSGFGISGYTLSDGSTDAAVTWAVASGVVADEDIQVTTESLADGGPYWILKRVGATDWRIDRSSTLPFLYSGNVLQYNQNNAGTWQDTNVTEDYYVNYWVFALSALPTTSISPAPSTTPQILIIPGQAIYASEGGATAETIASNITWGTIPFQEIAPLYQITMRYNAVLPSAYTNTARCAITRVTRIMGNKASITQAGAVDHGALAGLADDDHTQYALAGAIGSSRLTMSTGVLLGRGTAATGAVEEITLGTNLSLSGTTLNAAGGSFEPFGTISDQTTAYTILSTDKGKTIRYTGGSNAAFTLPIINTLSAGWWVRVRCEGGSDSSYVTLTRGTGNTFAGATTYIVPNNCDVVVYVPDTSTTTWKVENYPVMVATNLRAAIASTSMPKATGSASIAIGEGTQASAANTTAIGTNSGGNATGSQAVTGAGAMALGGSYASGTDSFAAGVANNTSSYGATGANSIAIGGTALASGARALALGQITTASGNGSVAISGFSDGGSGCTASGVGAIAIGDGASSLQYGKMAISSTGQVAGVQRGEIGLTGTTTDATPKVLTSNNSTAGTTNQVILPNNAGYAVRGQVIGRRKVSQADEISAWEFTAAIRRGANAASTTLVAAVTPTLIAQDAGLSTTVLAVTADTTNGGLAVTVTGIAATSIKWNATIWTTEATYA